MSRARERILERVRRANFGGEPDRAPAPPPLDARRPAIAPETIEERFVEKIASESLTGAIERLEAMEALPAAVERHLARNDLPPALAWSADPRLAALEGSAFALNETITADTPAAIAHADLGVAETGSLAFRSSAHQAVLQAFLPLHHLVVVRTRDLVAHLEDWARTLDPSAHPRNLLLITGTSGTADIEARNIRGAHGPKHLHVFLVR